MRKVLLLVFCSILIVTLHAQVSKKVNCTAGKLSSLLTTIEKNTISILTLEGTIDARDFKTMRDDMAALAVLDMSLVNVEAYYGAEGTFGSGDYQYKLNSIPKNAFYNSVLGSGKSNLIHVDLPQTVSLIDERAFNGCFNLNEIEFPGAIDTIQGFVFENCIGLDSIILPSSVQFIGQFAFKNCSNLVFIVLPSFLTNVEDGLFYNCSNLKTATIPSTLLSIGNSAFENCTSLTAITIPISTNSIGVNAFDKCLSLNSIDVQPLFPIKLYSNFSYFEDVNIEACKLYVPYSTFQLYKTADTWKNFLNIIEKEGFNLEKTSVQIDSANGSAASIKVLSNVTWTARSDQNWLTLTKASNFGNDDDSLVFVVSANPLGIQRVAKITVSAPNIPSQIITVTQLAGKEELTVSSTSISVSNTEGSSAFLNVYSNTNWRIQIEENWLSVNAESTIFGDKLLTITADENKNSVKRNTIISVIASDTLIQSVIVTQAAGNVTLSLAKDTLFISKLGGRSKEINVSHNSTIETATNSEWLKIVPETILNEEGIFKTSSFILFVDPNINETSRVAKIVISTKDLKYKTLTVVQESSIKELDIEAGKLASLLSNEEKLNLRHLSLNGTIDARDFATIRDLMDELEVIDLSLTTIVKYNGVKGTLNGFNTYAANVIPSSAFYNDISKKGKLSLKSIVLPKSIIGIGELAFNSCENLVNIEIPDGVNNIGKNAFSGCKSINEIEIPNLVRIISDKTFENCSGLKSVRLPKSITYIGSDAFRACNIDAIDLPASLITIGSSAFANCSALKMITIPEGVISIRNSAFSNCSELQLVVLPGSLDSIGNNAFYECEKLNFVELPTSLLFLDENVFFGCKELRTIVIPAHISAVSKGLFQNCYKLEKVFLPEMLKSIESNAFYNCERLSTIVLPIGTNAIGTSAFYNCIKLDSITLQMPDPINISSNCFYNVNKEECILNVTFGTKQKYKESPYWNDFKNINELDGFLIEDLSVNLDSTEGSFDHIKIQSNVTWTATTNQDWLILSSTTNEGKEADSIVFTAMSNPLGIEREAQIHITATGIKTQIVEVTQAAGKANLTISSTSVSLAGNGLDLGSLYVLSNANWMAKSNADWLTCNPINTVFGDGELILSAGENKNSKERSAKVTVYLNGTEKENINVTQMAGALSLILDNDTLFLSVKGSTKIAHNSSFKVNTDQSWLTISPDTIDNHEGTFKISNIIINAHPDIENPERTAKVRFTTDGFSRTLIVSQQLIYKEVETKAGQLKDDLNSYDKENINSLKITGIIDARDFNLMNSMNALIHVDLSEAFIESYSGYGGSYPSLDIAYKANAIPRRGFYGNHIASVILPNSINSIETEAFRHNTNLKAIEIPQSVKTIEQSAFSACGLKSITIPSSINNMEYYVFSDCDSLKELVLSEGLKKIGSYDFRNCFQLLKLFIPFSVWAISEGAFSNCTGLNSLIIDDGTQTIDEFSFQGCISLSSISIPPSVNHIRKYAFDNCTGLKLLEIKEGNYIIEENAFMNCSMLECVVLPSTINFLAESVFNACSNLNALYCFGETPLSLTDNALRFPMELMSDGILYVPAGSKSLYSVANVWSKFNQIVEMESLTLSSSNVVIDADEGSRDSITLTAAIGWTVNCDQAWLNVNSNMGNGDGTLVFTAERNISLNSRKAIVTLTATNSAPQIIVVTQLAQPVLKISSTKFFIAKEEGSFANCYIQSNANWNASVDQNWLSLNTTSGSGNDTLIFNVQTNLTATERIAKISISVKGIEPVIVTVTQAASEAKLSVSETDIKLGGNENVSSEFDIVSNSSWKVTSNQSWLKIDYAKSANVDAKLLNENAFLGINSKIGTESDITGFGNATLVCTAGINLAFAERTAKLTIYLDGIEKLTINVTQAAGKAVLMVSEKEIFLSAVEEVPLRLQIESNIKWRASTEQLWIHFSPDTFITGSGSLVLWFDSNNENVVRKGRIIIEGEGVGLQVIDVIQQPKVGIDFVSNETMVTLYPNPAFNQFKINGFEGKALLNICDINGRVLIKKDIRVNEYVSVKSLNEGVYFIWLNTDKGSYKQKLIVKE